MTNIATETEIIIFNVEKSKDKEKNLLKYFFNLMKNDKYFWKAVSRKYLRHLTIRNSIQYLKLNMETRAVFDSDT